MRELLFELRVPAGGSGRRGAPKKTLRVSRFPITPAAASGVRALLFLEPVRHWLQLPVGGARRWAFARCHSLGPDPTVQKRS